jgi:hypothetical protein
LVPPPARAGLLRPLLMLMRPQLEEHLGRLCVEAASGGQPTLAESLQKPCQQLAAPASACLVNEIDTSGRSIGVISEMLSGRVGDDSEAVIKRCVARLLNLPPDSLRDVPLKDLQRRFLPPQGGETRPGDRPPPS